MQFSQNLRVLPRVLAPNTRFFCSAIVRTRLSFTKNGQLGRNFEIIESWINPIQSRRISTSLRFQKDTDSENLQKSAESQESSLQKSILEEVLIHEKRKPTTFGGKVAEKASNTFMYTAVLAGIGLIGAFFYVLAGEFFAEDSPQTIFNKSLDLVRNDGRCQDIFGPTIAGFGEETSRGRRRHVAHHKYEKDGYQRIRVLFHVKGDRDEGIAQAEMEQRDGEWQWRFLYVENKRRPKTTHVLIDNR